MKGPNGICFSFPVVWVKNRMDRTGDCDIFVDFLARDGRCVEPLVFPGLEGKNGSNKPLLNGTDDVCAELFSGASRHGRSCLVIRVW